MARKIDITKSPESHCPKFDLCAIDKCPLHKDYSKLLNNKSDPSKVNKEKCTSKQIRKEIGRKFDLEFGGMTSKEFNASKALDISSKGAITPQNNFNRSLRVENELKPLRQPSADLYGRDSC